MGPRRVGHVDRWHIVPQRLFTKHGLEIPMIVGCVIGEHRLSIRYAVEGPGLLRTPPSEWGIAEYVERPSCVFVAVWLADHTQQSIDEALHDAARAIFGK